MNLIHMVFIIPAVPDPMFLEAALPYAPFPFIDPDFRPPLGAGQRLYEADLDRLPAIRKIVIARRQGLDAVQMVRKHHPSINIKRMFYLHILNTISQNMPTMGHHREKVSASFSVCTAVVRHYSGSTNNKSRRVRFTHYLSPCVQQMLI